MDELTALRTETGKTFELERTAKGRKQYQLEASTGPIHYKETYVDGEPWLDLDETYSEASEIKGIGKVLVYPKLPNITTVFQDVCGYRIQSRSNPDHVARVELVSVDGLPVTKWLDTASIKTSARVHPYRVGIWKDFSRAVSAKATTMRWKVTELGDGGKDSHPFVFSEIPEAYNTKDYATLDPVLLDQAKVEIQTQRTRIDDTSWYWDEIVPAEAKLVDTDFQVGAGGDDGYWGGSSVFDSSGAYCYFCNNYNAFMRFQSVTCPAGCVITAAKCSLRADRDESYSNTLYLNCHMNDVADAEAPTSYATAEAKVLTTAYSAWEITTGWTKDAWYDTPSMVDSVQEVVDLGFESGNDMMALIMESSGAFGYHFYSYDGAGASAPKLVLTWTVPSGHPTSKRMAGIKYAATRKGVW